MAYKKRLTTLTKINSGAQDKAIEAHAGFVRFIVSQVEKEGLKDVLSRKPEDEGYWLKKSFNRVLDFAEQIQIKQVPTKLEGTGNGGAIPVIAYLPQVKDEPN